MSLWLHEPNKNYFWEQDGHFVRIQALVVNKEYSGSLQFAPGVTSMTISIPIISDNINEPAETFEVRLSSASNANILDDLAIVTILEGAITTRAINSNEKESGESQIGLTVHVIPNPSNNQIDKISIVIFDILGRIVEQKKGCW